VKDWCDGRRDRGSCRSCPKLNLTVPLTHRTCSYAGTPIYHATVPRFRGHAAHTRWWWAMIDSSHFPSEKVYPAYRHDRTSAVPFVGGACTCAFRRFQPIMIVCGRNDSTFRSTSVHERLGSKVGGGASGNFFQRQHHWLDFHCCSSPSCMGSRQVNSMWQWHSPATSHAMVSRWLESFCPSPLVLPIIYCTVQA